MRPPAKFDVLRVALVSALLLGCGRRNESFIPTAPLAQKALTAALDSWVRGDSSATLPDGAPKIQLADSRRDGRKLAKFKILGEVSADGGRRFDVELQLSEPTKIEKTQYVVVGIDPLWVIRQEDYDMITHWDHPMPSEPAADQKQPSEEQTSKAEPREQPNE